MARTSVLTAVAVALVLVPPPLAAAERAETFAADGNLVAHAEEVDSGELHFVVNQAFTGGKNHAMIFGNSLSRGPLATNLWHRGRRQEVYAEVLLLLAQSPSPDLKMLADWSRDELAERGWRASTVAEVADYFDAYKMNYWKTGTDGAALHNSIAVQLRGINPRTVDGRALPTTNLKSVSRALLLLEVSATICDVAVGAAVRAAVDADMALYRLEVLEDALADADDPAVAAAIADAREQLTGSDDMWGAFIVEVDARKGELARMGTEKVVAYAMKAMGAKGTLGVLLVWETIVADWKQHDNGQGTVIAATVEERLREAAAATDNDPDRCELERLALMARFIYFDRMVKVCSVWQGAWVDLLSKGSPYADAKDYYRNERASRVEAIRSQRAEAPCRDFSVEGEDVADRDEGVVIVDPGGVLEGGGGMPETGTSDDVDLIFCIDTTGSMDDDIDAAKRSARQVIDTIFAASSDPRVALVAYRDYGDAYVTRGYPFTRARDEIDRHIQSLTVGGGGDAPEAVYEALLHAINTDGLGAWRAGVKKIVILIGDAPPHSRRHTLDEVARRAEEVDPAHVFPIAVKGASSDALRAMAEIAERTGGFMLQTGSAAELPAKMMKMVELSRHYADTTMGYGRVQWLDGGLAGVHAPACSCDVGQLVLLFDPERSTEVVATAMITSVVGDELTVEIRDVFSISPPRAGGRVGLDGAR